MDRPTTGRSDIRLYDPYYIISEFIVRFGFYLQKTYTTIGIIVDDGGGGWWLFVAEGRLNGHNL